MRLLLQTFFSNIFLLLLAFASCETTAKVEPVSMSIIRNVGTLQLRHTINIPNATSTHNANSRRYIPLNPRNVIVESKDLFTFIIDYGAKLPETYSAITANKNIPNHIKAFCQELPCSSVYMPYTVLHNPASEAILKRYSTISFALTFTV